ncbi:YihY/virulence factor BrkB family protein [Myxococcota bacterium]|nr:YihY/virulence factor BrkB family protein [Myxococcota bacterium]MBU1383080.1 YihY/virulence factor BrkB family protein [Myxococcota bacterium]MBU1498253.1 YihY/virulence factor BrkB family protein [Myxococcota bacterium]
MKRTIARFKRRLGKPLSHLPAHTRWFTATFRYFRHILKIWNVRDSFRIASALAFESLFSLVPLVALALWLIDAAGQSVQVKALSNYIGRQLFPSFGPDAVNMITKLASRIKGDYLGTVGAVATVLISILVFLSIEKALNEIWEVKKRRGFFSQFSTYWTLSSLVPLIGLIVFLRRADYPIISSQYTSHAILLFMFFLLNKLVPNTPVNNWPAFVGALFTFVFFQVARILFSTYFSSKYFGIYGEIGVLFLMLVWIYYIWLVVIFGAIAAFVTQRFSYLEDRRITESRWAVFPGEPIAWRAWTILDYMYMHRELHDTQAISAVTGESGDMVDLICQRLAEENIVFRVAGRWGLAIENGRKINLAMIARIFSRVVPAEAGKSTYVWQEMSDYFVEIGETITLEDSAKFEPGDFSIKRYTRELHTESFRRISYESIPTVEESTDNSEKTDNSPENDLNEKA